MDALTNLYILLKARMGDEEGQDLIEYALILSIRWNYIAKC
jgi:hypothetical protein